MSEPVLTVRSFGLTDRGRRRATNEDQFLVAELTKTMRIAQSSLSDQSSLAEPERGYLFLVADGMGGHKAGEHASALAVAMIEQFTLKTFKWFLQYDEPGPETAATEFDHAIQQADRAIIDAAERNPEFEGMGTTLTLAYAVGDRLFVLHVGDSRAYLFREGTLRQLTHDHTLFADMVRRGEISPDEAGGHRLRHVVTNVLGGADAGVRTEAHRLDLRADDCVLLCSDGLTEMVPVEEIGTVLAARSEPKVMCEQLIAAANERGGHDNVTVIVAQFSGNEP
jgi:protein phosphatase